MNRQIKLIIIAVVVLLLIFGLMSFRKSASFHLVRSTPAIGKRVPSSTSLFKLDFNRALDESSISFDNLTDPQGIVTGMKASDKSLRIYVEDLEKREYTLELKNIKAKDGSVISKLPLKFKVVYVEANKLSDAEEELLMETTDRGRTEDPVLQFVPHGGLSYYLEGISSRDADGLPVVRLSARLQLSRADTSNRDAAIETYKQDVLSYLRSKQINPDKYDIEYIVIEPPF